jgi:Ca2+-dependent lipid-binding protein
MTVDVVMLLEDAVLMLDIKPSSLDYKMVPSTKVSINSFDAQMTMDVSVKVSAEYPYISFVNVSLAEIPDFNLRIVPQQESGLKGVDFASFPLISKWVKEAINSALGYYLSPQFISVDIPGWLYGNATDGETVKYYLSGS